MLSSIRYLGQLTFSVCVVLTELWLRASAVAYRSGCLGMKKFLWLFLAPASASPLLAQTPAPLVPQLPEQPPPC